MAYKKKNILSMGIRGCIRGARY